MNWVGDTYRITSGEYAIQTQYCARGELNIAEHRGQIIGYATSLTAAKAACAIHQRQSQPQQKAA